MVKRAWENIGLRSKFLTQAFLVYAATGLLALAALWSISNDQTQRVGVAYASKYALASATILRDALERETVLARLMAGSPIIRDWVEHEDDEIERAKAFEELARYQGQFADKTWFLVVHSSLRYYFDDPKNPYGPTRMAYTLDPQKEQDKWYFASVEKVSDYALNVNYDSVLGVHKVWVNVILRAPDGRPLGMIGTGLDLSKFLHLMVDTTEPGAETIILDRQMAIQACRERALIDLQSVAKPIEAQSKVDRLLDVPEEAKTIAKAIHSVAQGSYAETFPLHMNGKRRLAAVAGLSSLDWYVLSALDLDQVIGRQFFGPPVLLGIGLTLLLFALMERTVTRMVLRPIAAVTEAAERISEGDYDVELPADRRDEVGVLARTFLEMKDKIRENTEQLEHRVARRTCQLNDANIQLTENMKKLEEALANVRKLEGILPICAFCKKIRDDAGYWTQVEEYVEKHSSAAFTHGICPECAKSNYPELSLPDESES